jgi:hypothetical protein
MAPVRVSSKKRKQGDDEGPFTFLFAVLLIVAALYVIYYLTGAGHGQR